MLTFLATFPSHAAAVRLAWNANPETDVTGYRLHVGTAAGNYTTIINVGNVLTYDLNSLSADKTYFFALTAYSGAGIESDYSQSISYKANTPPIASSFPATTLEDTPVVITLTGSDPDGQAISYTSITSPTRGLLSGTAPNLTYVPFPNANGTDQFTYKTSDGITESAAATVSITIVPQNDPPQPASLDVSVLENKYVSVTIPGVDVDGDALTFQLITPPSRGAISGFLPFAIYTPQKQYSGPDSFTVSISDGVASSLATVSITVIPDNKAPVVANLPISVSEDGSITFTIAATDPDDDPLTFLAGKAPLKGTLSGSGPSFTYTPAADYSGPDTFTVRVSDGELETEGTVTVTVTAVNDAPTADPQSLQGIEDTNLPITLTGKDKEGSPLTFKVVTPPTNGSLQGTAPNLVYVPNANFAGQDSFTIEANDGDLTSAPALISINLTSTGDAPVASNMSVTTLEDTPVTIKLACLDADNDSLTAASAGTVLSTLITASKGTVTFNGTEATYTPPANFFGTDTFQFIVNDGQFTSTNATVTVTVTAVNDPPSPVSRSLKTAEDTAVSFGLRSTDVEGNPVTYTIVTPPANGTLTGTPTNLKYTPNPNWFGTDRLWFSVADADQGAELGYVTISVSAVNDAPVAKAATVNLLKGVATSFVLSGQDVENSPLTYKVTVLPKNGTLSGTAPNLVYTPKATFTGTDTISFTVGDGLLTSTAATVTFNVTAPVLTAPPVPTTLGAVVLFGQSTSTLSNGDTALPGATQNLTVQTSPAQGSLTVNADGTFAYQHAGGTALTDQFTYTTTADGATTTTTVTVHVLRVLGGSVTGNTTTLEFSVGAGLQYRVEFQDGALAPTGPWQTLTTLTGEVDGIATITDGSGVAGIDRFYRIVWIGTGTSLTTEPWLRPAY